MNGSNSLGYDEQLVKVELRGCTTRLQVASIDSEKVGRS
jgi:hypothetical protein